MAAIKVRVSKKAFIDGWRRRVGDEFVWMDPPDPLPAWATLVEEEKPKKPAPQKKAQPKKEVDPLS